MSVQSTPGPRPPWRIRGSLRTPRRGRPLQRAGADGTCRRWNMRMVSVVCPDVRQQPCNSPGRQQRPVDVPFKYMGLSWPHLRRKADRGPGCRLHVPRERPRAAVDLSSPRWGQTQSADQSAAAAVGLAGRGTRGSPQCRCQPSGPRRTGAEPQRPRSSLSRLLADVWCCLQLPTTDYYRY